MTQVSGRCLTPVPLWDNVRANNNLPLYIRSVELKLLNLKGFQRSLPAAAGSPTQVFPAFLCHRVCVRDAFGRNGTFSLYGFSDGPEVITGKNRSVACSVTTYGLKYTLVVGAGIAVVWPGSGVYKASIHFITPPSHSVNGGCRPQAGW
ncbi:hypothetical protein ACQUQU_12345 [Thalassolituus sp. LLYu03]|uniref:hypothetical protein n=1 Tax=Thalassolituus sp. LLYu03 TaxID=3421656 RepID=UPI003D2A4AC3